jgi:hypothetical protein
MLFIYDLVQIGGEKNKHSMQMFHSMGHTTNGGVTNGRTERAT